MDFTDLVTKYKALLLDNLQVFILVFGLGCALVWFLIHARIGNAKGEIALLERHVKFYKEQSEHFQHRLEAIEIQSLKTSTPPKLKKQKPD